MKLLHRTIALGCACLGLSSHGLVIGVAVAQPALASSIASRALAEAPADGVIRLRSSHDFVETVRRLKADVAAKGIRFFDEIDQARLGAEASITVPRSTLILFGNPPLGLQFLASNPFAGLDWPVRMLVVQGADGSVWIAWTDFGHIARRYRITDREPQFRMASEVAASIAAAAAK